MGLIITEGYQATEFILFEIRFLYLFSSPAKNIEGRDSHIRSLVVKFLQNVDYVPQPTNLDLTLEEAVLADIASLGVDMGIEKELFHGIARLGGTMADVRQSPILTTRSFDSWFDSARLHYTLGRQKSKLPCTCCELTESFCIRSRTDMHVLEAWSFGPKSTSIHILKP